MKERPCGEAVRDDLSELRVAIVHYWFVSRRGGERVVEAIAEVFPQADIFTLVADRNRMAPALREHKLTMSLVQKIPGSTRWHRHLLPLYPYALEQFDLRGYDLVISSESGPAKGVLTGADTCHICYCHSPMRYIWDMYHDYMGENGNRGLKRAIFSFAAHYVRQWDLASASRVDYFVANSHNVAARIAKHYRREATVIYPPVNVENAIISGSYDDYYLFVGQLVDYKRADIAIHACNLLGRRLRIAGKGEQCNKLRQIAGPTIEFIGSPSDSELAKEYARCRALLFPGEEDFGIVPVEAQSYGRPVIAFDKGGALETVRGFYPADGYSPGSTGVFFSSRNAESLAEAMIAFEKAEARFSAYELQAHARKFRTENFKHNLRSFVEGRYMEFKNNGTQAKLRTHPEERDLQFQR
jgi:glycosyltransferase involved in cell wall biosynthesis